MPCPRSRFLAATAAAALFFASPASAAIIGVEIVTTVFTSSSDVGHTLPGAGEAAILSFSYDDAVPDSLPAPGIGNFLNSLQTLSVEFPDSGLAFSWSGGQSILSTVDDQSSPGPGMTTAFTDALNLGSTTGPVSGLIDGATVDALSFVFVEVEFDAQPTMIVNDRPNPPFSFDSDGLFTIAGVNLAGLGNNLFNDTIVLTSGTANVVPEPGAAALVLTGFGLAAGLRSRRP